MAFLKIDSIPLEGQVFVDCLRSGIPWSRLRRIIPKEKENNYLHYTSLAIREYEDKVGINPLRSLEEKELCDPEETKAQVQTILSKYDDTYILIGYKRSGRAILEKLDFPNKKCLRNMKALVNFQTDKKPIFIDDDISTGKTVKTIKQFLPIENVILLNSYYKTEEELNKNSDLNWTVIREPETLTPLRKKGLVLNDYEDDYRFKVIIDFDLASNKAKFQYPDWQDSKLEVISLDIDGTLTHRLLNDLRKRNPEATIIVNTGRDLWGALKIFEDDWNHDILPSDIKLVNYIIASDGNTIYDVKQKTIMENDNDKLNGVINLLMRINYRGGKIVHYGDTEHDLVFFKNGFEVNTPKGSEIENVKGVKVYEEEKK